MSINTTRTTITVHKETIGMLENFKIYPRETLEDVILRFMKEEKPKVEPIPVQKQGEA